MTIRPASVAELCQLVKKASAARQPIYPVGGNSQSQWLAPISKPGLTIDMTGIHQLIDFPAEDMTVTVEAGMTMLALQQLLHEKGMWLPLDVPHPDKATIGGSLAANITGSRRTGFGTWRDYVLGIQWINDHGEEVKAGGRVVKNVAGYDFCKLLIGSLGTLGIITQVTLKLRPLPKMTGFINGQVKACDMGRWCRTLQQSWLRPSSALLNQVGDYWISTISFEDNQDAVTWQISEVERVLPQISLKPGADYGNPLSRQGLSWQAILPRDKCGAWANAIVTADSQVQLHPWIGWATGSIQDDDLNTVRHRVDLLRQSAAELGGFVILSSCPTDWRSALQPFGPHRPDWNLMQLIKRTLDPHNLFQTDRYEVLHGE